MGNASAAPSTDRTPGHLPQGKKPGQPTEVREPEAPTVDHLRSQINEILDYISDNRESLLNSRQSLVYELTVKVNGWEREQRHFPNPVGDVP